VTEVGKSMEPRIPQGHEGTIALSGTAPNAEALAKFSAEYEGNNHERQRATEAGMPMDPRNQQDHEETIALSGTDPNVEALEKVSTEHEAEVQTHQQGKVDNKSPSIEYNESGEQELNVTEQFKVFDDDDHDIRQMLDRTDAYSDGNSSHPEDRQLAGIWKTNAYSAVRVDKEISKEEENAQTTNATMKRQRPLG
jgi:hypothetical protein